MIFHNIFKWAHEENNIVDCFTSKHVLLFKCHMAFEFETIEILVDESVLYL